MQQNLIADWSEYSPFYKLLDSGQGEKLEIIAGHRVLRPSVQAIWKKSLSPTEWQKTQSISLRQKDGGGQWKHLQKPPSDLTLTYKDLKFRLKFTNFGHCGLFFEQLPLWDQLTKVVEVQKQKLKRPPKILNLFAYTGAASIIMAAQGAEVYHVDSARGILEWAQENVELNKSLLMSRGGNLKLVHEDAQKFVAQAFKKDLKFDGVLADPPTWGHGAKKEVWDFEKHFTLLISNISHVIQKKNFFFILTSHTPGVQAEALKNLLADLNLSGELVCGDLGLKEVNSSRILPAGIYATLSSHP